MTKEIKELSNQLITELQKLIENIDYFCDNDNEIKDYEDDKNDSNQKRFQKQETWYDQMYEKYLKTEKLIEGKDLFQNLLNEFQKRTENFFQ